MVIVLPPLTTLPAFVFCRNALHSERGLTPRWLKKYSSSNARILKTNFEFRVLLSGKRHCPSAAIFADSRLPSLSLTIKETGSLNKGRGRQNKKPIAHPANKANASHSFLCVFNECKKSRMKPA